MKNYPGDLSQWETVKYFHFEWIIISDNCKQLPSILIYRYLCGFHTRCLYWVSRQPSPRSNYSPSPPMKLMTSQSLPPSSASSVMIMSHRIDLAGLAHRENPLTFHCFLTWNSNQSDKNLPSLPPGFHTKQVSHPPTDRSGPGFSADT